MESGKKQREDLVSCLVDILVVISPASSTGRRWPGSGFIFRGCKGQQQWGRDYRFEQWQVGSHKELQLPVLSVRKWDDVSPWGRE